MSIKERYINLIDKACQQQWFFDGRNPFEITKKIHQVIPENIVDYEDISKALLDEIDTWKYIAPEDKRYIWTKLMDFLETYIEVKHGEEDWTEEIGRIMRNE